ncbi:MAG TPA: hypothetical protein VII83_03690 [Gaiellaceae bacterium]
MFQRFFELGNSPRSDATVVSGLAGHSQNCFRGFDIPWPLDAEEPVDEVGVKVDALTACDLGYESRAGGIYGEDGQEIGCVEVLRQVVTLSGCRMPEEVRECELANLFERRINVRQEVESLRVEFLVDAQRFFRLWIEKKRGLNSVTANRGLEVGRERFFQGVELSASQWPSIGKHGSPLAESRLCRLLTFDCEVFQSGELLVRQRVSARGELLHGGLLHEAAKRCRYGYLLEV